MNQIFSVLLFFFNSFIIRAATVTYAFGMELRFDYYTTAGFLCQNTATPSYTFKTSFGTGISFANKPKVIITDTYYGISYNAPNDFTFTIIDTSLTDFTATVACPTPNRMWSLRFNWTAIDDQRIEVITIQNLNMVDVPSQIYQYPHSNPNALQGYISLMHFGWNGPFIFNLDIVKITPDFVQVKYTAGNNNCRSLGYQIILATSQALNQSDLLVNHLTDTIKYNSGTLTIPPGQKLLTPISGMNYPAYLYHMRVRRIYSESSTTITYRWEIWELSDQDIYHKQVWLTLPVVQLFTPMIHKKTRVSKKDNPFAQFNDIMKLTIVESNKSFKIASDSGDFIIESTSTLVNMIIYFQCGYWQKIQGQVFACPTCLNQFISINEIGFEEINEVTHYVTLQKQDTANYLIHVDVTSQGFTITQTIFNQVLEKYTLLWFKISNK